jgi:hypothetical protein
MSAYSYISASGACPADGISVQAVPEMVEQCAKADHTAL